MAPALRKVDTDRFFFGYRKLTEPAWSKTFKECDPWTTTPSSSCYEEIHCQLIVVYETNIFLGGQDNTKTLNLIFSHGILNFRSRAASVLININVIRIFEELKLNKIEKLRLIKVLRHL